MRNLIPYQIIHLIKRWGRYVVITLSPSFWRNIITSVKYWAILARKGRLIVPDSLNSTPLLQGILYITGDVTIEINEQLGDYAKRFELIQKFEEKFKQTLEHVLLLPGIVMTFFTEVFVVVGIWQKNQIEEWLTSLYSFLTG